MREIYSIISECKGAKECVLVSGIDGDVKGEKALYIDGELAYKTSGAKLLDEGKGDWVQTIADGVSKTDRGLVFTERFGIRPRIIVCGAGTVGLEVIKLGKMLGFTVIALEDRQEYAKKAMELQADEVYCEEFVSGLDKLDERKADYYIVVTREHQFDKACIEKILGRRHAYVGMMASKNRGIILKDALIKEGYDPNEIEKIHSPIGLKINAETPAEIAVSIFAEIINLKNDEGMAEGYTKEILKGITSIKSDERAILATIVKRVGSAPRDVGAKMLVYEDGRITGTVGGGWIETEAKSIARKMFSENIDSELFETDRESEDAMLCGGYETIYLEMI